MTAFYAKLLSSSLAGAGASLLAASLALLLEKPRVRKRTVLQMAVAAVLLLGISAFLGLDVRVPVPDLNLRPFEEAASLLAESHLATELIPSDEQPSTEPGRVLPNTQSLPGGQFLRWGGIVSFKISDVGTTSIDHPRTNNAVDCTAKASGFCAFDADGTGSRLVQDRRLDLVLWAKSNESNWFPQRPNPAIIEQNGTWKGEVQVGNSRYPPSDGELVDVMLTALPRGTMVQSRPDGLPQPQGRIVANVERVAIRLIRK